MKKTLLIFVMVLMASLGAQVLATTLDEALNVAGGNISFEFTGEYPWIVVTEGGRTFAQSSNAGVHSSTSTLTATVTVARAATVSFDFKAWGEGTSVVWDKCEFVLDGEPQFSYGAYKNDWQTTSVRIDAGTHTLMWSYDKDSSLNPEGDYFAVDNVAVMADAIIMLGDVNGDGNVTISDVTALIDYLLSGDEGSVMMINCDVNKDGKVAISDVTALIDLLLSGERNPMTCVVEGVSFTMMPVQSGSFTMGATAEQDEAYDWEKPAHQVTLTSPY